MIKLNKNLIFCIIIVISALLLSACSFVQFVSYDDGNDLISAEQNAAIIEEKENYINELHSCYVQDNYRYKQQREIELDILEAENEINELCSIDDIVSVFLKHKAFINSVPTDLALYKSEAAEEIIAYYKESDYRENELDLLLEIRALYLNNIYASEDKNSIDKEVREYIIAAYTIKTDAALYADELVELKNLAISDISLYKDLSLYRENERSIITSKLNEYLELINSATVKEDLTTLVLQYKFIVDSLKTNAQLLYEEKIQYADFVIDRLIKKSNVLTHSEDEGTALIEKLEKLRLEYYEYDTIEEIGASIAIVSRDLCMDGALAGDIDCINIFKDVVIYDLDSSVDYSRFRKNEQLQIKEKEEQIKIEIETITDINALLSYYDIFSEYLLTVPTNVQLWEKTTLDFINDLHVRYGNNVLSHRANMTEANNYYELADIIDFFAFYQKDYESFMCPYFCVKLNYTHRDAQYEINEVYWYCELLRSAVGITGWLENEDYLVVQLVPYHLASHSNLEHVSKVNRYFDPVEFDSDKSLFQSRDDSFNDFAYKQYERSIDGVWNTQQLWYALEHEYVPECVPNSPADIYLKRAESILRDIISEGMTDDEKIFNIYKWMATNIRYDNYYSLDLAASDKMHFPDENTAKSKAFHIEGAIEEGLAVCEGYAKTYLLLLRIEGIESYRYFARNHLFEGKNAIALENFPGYGSHAFVSIKMSDGKFYISDSDQSLINGCDSYHHMMIHPSLFIAYDLLTDMYPDMVFGDDLSYFYDKLIFDNNKIYVKNKQDLELLLNEFSSLSVEVKQLSILVDEKSYADFRSDLNNIGGDCFDGYQLRSASDNMYCFSEYILYKS